MINNLEFENKVKSKLLNAEITVSVSHSPLYTDWKSHNFTTAVLDVTKYVDSVSTKCLLIKNMCQIVYHWL